MEELLLVWGTFTGTEVWFIDGDNYISEISISTGDLDINIE